MMAKKKSSGGGALEAVLHRLEQELATVRAEFAAQQVRNTSKRLLVKIPGKRYDHMLERDIMPGVEVAADLGAGRYVRATIVEIFIGQVSNERRYEVERLDGKKRPGLKKVDEIFPQDILNEGEEIEPDET